MDRSKSFGALKLISDVLVAGALKLMSLVLVAGALKLGSVVVVENPWPLSPLRASSRLEPSGRCEVSNLGRVVVVLNWDWLCGCC